MLAVFIKATFVLLLFMLFFNFFGLPSLARYLERKTFFSAHDETYDPKDIPAISIR